MRTLGDMNWLNDYIGIPYVEGGRDYKGCDCYGLVKLVYQFEYGIELPDWCTDHRDFKRYDKMIKGVVCGGDFTPMDAPHDGSFVIVERAKLSHHIGLFYGSGVLHAERGMGSIYEPLSRFKQRFPNCKFGEWHP
jgi:hypothetical protein